MSILTMRLVVAFFFTVMGVVVLARSWAFPWLDTQFDPLRLNLGGLLALVLAGVNLARWYMIRSFMKQSRTAVRYPLQRDPSAAPQDQPIPEFDFTKQQGEAQAGMEREKGNDWNSSTNQR